MKSEIAWLLGIILFNIDIVNSFSICVGNYHTCFVSTSAELKCWGDGTNSQTLSTFSFIGDSSGEMKALKPIATSVTDVTCGAEFTCFVKTDKSLYCFGQNSLGQIGIGSSAATISTASLVPIANTISVSAYDDLACAVSTDVKCWGFSSSIYLSSYGSTPISVSGISSPAQVAVGGSHICARTASGTVYCWGSNTYGQLGIGSTTSTSTATLTNIPFSVVSVSAGSSHTCVVRLSDTTVSCFGKNSYGQLGDKTLINRGTVPSDMSSLSTSLGFGIPYPGNDITCIVSTTYSGLFCLGDNINHANCAYSFTSLDAASQAPPNYKLEIGLAVTSTSSVKMATGTGSHVCATDGTTVYCWGNNIFGQLGIDSSISQTSCTTAKPLQKVCFESCSTKNNNTVDPNLFIRPIISAVIPVAIFLIFFGCAMFIGCRRRAEFDRQVYLLPAGGQVTGAQIWNSYTHPIGPMTAIAQNQPLAVGSFVAPATKAVAYVPNV